MTASTFRRAYGNGHSYTLDGVPKTKGVTTMMKGLPKNLEKYFVEGTAGYAVDHWDELAELPPAERLKKIAAWSKQRFTSAGVKGTRVHALAEKIITGAEVVVPDDIRGYVEACIQFLDDYHVEPLLIEPALFSRTHRYAGSADFFATALKPHATSRIRILGDYKTSASGPWGDMSFQLAGYRYADFYLGPEGEELPVPTVDECWIVWLRADGYDVYPMHVDEAVHRQLLYIDQCRIADEDCKNYKGDALPHPDGVRKVRLADIGELTP